MDFIVSKINNKNLNYLHECALISREHFYWGPNYCWGFITAKTRVFAGVHVRAFEAMLSGVTRQDFDVPSCMR